MSLLSTLSPKLLSTALVAGALLAPAGCVIAGDAKHERTAEVTLTHQDNAPIRVGTENGAIEIVADDDAEAVSIVAEIKAQTRERAEAVMIKAERSADGTLSVEAVWPEKRLNNEGCSFTIHLPNAHGVEATTANGRIDIHHLSGPANLETSNGRITVLGHQGPVDAQTSNGRIEIDGAVGEVKAHTSNGRITVEQATGPVSAKTSNGQVAIHMAPGASGPVNVKTSNGSIEFTFASGFVGTLEMDTSMGSIEFTDAAGETVRHKNHLEIEVGSGGPHCTFETSLGSISVAVHE